MTICEVIILLRRSEIDSVCFKQTSCFCVYFICESFFKCCFKLFDTFFVCWLTVRELSILFKFSKFVFAFFQFWFQIHDHGWSLQDHGSLQRLECVNRRVCGNRRRNSSEFGFECFIVQYFYSKRSAIVVLRRHVLEEFCWSWFHNTTVKRSAIISRLSVKNCTILKSIHFFGVSFKDCRTSQIHSTNQSQRLQIVRNFRNNNVNSFRSCTDCWRSLCSCDWSCCVVHGCQHCILRLCFYVVGECVDDIVILNTQRTANFFSCRRNLHIHFDSCRFFADLEHFFLNFGQCRWKLSCVLCSDLSHCFDIVCFNSFFDLFQQVCFHFNCDFVHFFIKYCFEWIKRSLQRQEVHFAFSKSQRSWS